MRLRTGDYIRVKKPNKTIYGIVTDANSKGVFYRDEHGNEYFTPRSWIEKLSVLRLQCLEKEFKKLELGLNTISHPISKQWEQLDGPEFDLIIFYSADRTKQRCFSNYSYIKVVTNELVKENSYGKIVKHTYKYKLLVREERFKFA